MTALTKEEFWAELDQLTETEVRVRLQTKLYSDLNQKGAFAREWLLRREFAARESAQAEQAAKASRAVDAAERAAAAAERQATTARNANRIAIAALTLAAISLIISLFRP